MYGVCVVCVVWCVGVCVGCVWAVIVAYGKPTPPVPSSRKNRQIASKETKDETVKGLIWRSTWTALCRVSGLVHMSDDEAVVPPTPKVVEGAADSRKFSFFLSSSHLSPKGRRDARDPNPESYSGVGWRRKAY